MRHPVAKRLGQLAADLVRLCRNDHRGFYFIQSFYNKIDCLNRRSICDDGVQRKNPALEYAARYKVQQDIINHNKRSNRNSKPLCKYDGKHFHTINSASKPYRQSTSDP